MKSIEAIKLLEEIKSSNEYPSKRLSQHYRKAINKAIESLTMQIKHYKENNKLDLLPDWIELPSRMPLEDTNEKDWYAFDLSKDDGKYNLSYYCYLREDTLIEFEGDFNEVVNKMYDWCKEHGYIL